MKNKILKPGEYVKYYKENNSLALLNIELGRVYEIEGGKEKALTKERRVVIPGTDFRILLVDASGELTEYSDYFAKHQCPVLLPKGNQP